MDSFEKWEDGRWFVVLPDYDEDQEDLEKSHGDRYIGSLFRVDEPVPDDSPIHYKARNEKGSTEARAIYNVLGIDKYGHKDLLGMYVSHRLP